MNGNAVPPPKYSVPAMPPLSFTPTAGYIQAPLLLHIIGSSIRAGLVVAVNRARVHERKARPPIGRE